LLAKRAWGVGTGTGRPGAIHDKNIIWMKYDYVPMSEMNWPFVFFLPLLMVWGSPWLLVTVILGEAIRTEAGGLCMLAALWGTCSSWQYPLSSGSTR
jgi:hypothetical protein